MENKKLLEIRNLSVNYETDLETVYAVNNISIEIGKGKTLGIVGETGAGKTTMALSILRLLPERTGKIKSGEIIFDSQNLLELKENQMRQIRGAKISMIYQDPMTSLNPVVTVGNQIAETLELHNHDALNKAQIRGRVGELLEMVGIPAFRSEEYPHQFSGGMKQRVVIAMALACRPQLILADEPTTALDVTIQSQVLLMMAELKEKLNTSMILITHDLGIVAQTCDEVAVMYAGELIEKGTVQDIFEGGVNHPYTMGLFGSIPDIERSDERLSPIVGLMPDPTDLPGGCKFHPRCPKCGDRCRTEEPPEHKNGTHAIKCHLMEGR